MRGGGDAPTVDDQRGGRRVQSLISGVGEAWSEACGLFPGRFGEDIRDIRTMTEVVTLC
jgi:hypothetical protein